MEKDYTKLDLSKKVSVSSKSFFLDVKNVAHAVGIGYDQIYDNLPKGKEVFAIQELIDIAKDVKSGKLKPLFTGDPNKLYDLIKEGFRDKDELPF